MHDLVLITLNWLFKNLGRYSRLRRASRGPRRASHHQPAGPRASLSGRMEQRKKEEEKHRREAEGSRWREKEGKEEGEWKEEAER